MTKIRKVRSEFGELWERDCPQPENWFMRRLMTMCSWIPAGDRSPGIHMWLDTRPGSYLHGDNTVYQYVRVVRPGFWDRLLNNFESSRIDAEIRAFHQEKDEWNGDIFDRG